MLELEYSLTSFWAFRWMVDDRPEQSHKHLTRTQLLLSSLPDGRSPLQCLPGKQGNYRGNLVPLGGGGSHLMGEIEGGLERQLGITDLGGLVGRLGDWLTGTTRGRMTSAI